MRSQVASLVSSINSIAITKAIMTIGYTYDAEQDRKIPMSKFDHGGGEADNGRAY